MTQDYPIVTVEQDDFIKNILRVKTGFMKHNQVGEILTLASECGQKEYQEALLFIQRTVGFEEAETYKEDLIRQILANIHI